MSTHADMLARVAAAGDRIRAQQQQTKIASALKIVHSGAADPLPTGVRQDKSYESVNAEAFAETRKAEAITAGALVLLVFVLYRAKYPKLATAAALLALYQAIAYTQIGKFPVRFPGVYTGLKGVYGLATLSM